ncbi:kinase-like protein [Testicularia cyperi]|uniref:Kinase-like protein n=1 Tax=Testicularia cyperi TaxID=1882483 RepID=A0A317XZG5_9BASI|nr:kinase-like protein [Testicularia cyperi]
MTAISRRPDYPPSTPIYRRSLRQAGAGAGSSAISDLTPSDRTNATISDSPLPPAPVSHFLGEDEFEHDVVHDLPVSIGHSASTHPRAVRSYRYSNAIREPSPPIIDDDSPGMGRRAAPSASHLEDIDVPRASSLFSDHVSKSGTGRSSPFASASTYIHEEHRSKSSPAFRPSALHTGTRTSRGGGISPIHMDDDSLEARPAPVSRRRSNEKYSVEAAEERRVRYATEVEERASVKRSSPDTSSPDHAPPSVIPTGVPLQHSDYRTPAMAGRTLRSSAATSATATAPRSAGRSLRKLTRSSNCHPPARRVVRRYSDDEDEELEEEGEGADKENSGPDARSVSPESAKGKEKANDDGNSGPASGSGSNSRSSPGVQEPERPDPRYLPYGYDAQKARMRAEMLERASLVRSPSPRQAPAGEDAAVPQHAPPPRRSEAYPSSRPPAPVPASAPKEHNVSISADDKKASVGVIQDFLASSVAPPADPLSRRKNVVPSSADLLGSFSSNPGFTVSASAAAPIASIASLVAPPEEPSGEDLAKMFSDFRPEAIFTEAGRQAREPLTSHEDFMKKLHGATKCIRMQGLKFRKPKGGRSVGKGGFSVVHVVRGPVCERVKSADNPDVIEEIAIPDEQQGFFALKLVDLKEIESDQDKLDLIAEANLLRTLADLPGSEPYLLRYYGHQVTGDANGNPDKLRILMEVGDSDFSRILANHAPLPREMIAHYFRQMLEAVQFIHDADMVHADLKPANFLNVNDRLKLIDFGISKQIQQGTVHISRDNIIGTPNYMAPEAIKTQRSKGRRVYKAGKPSDVWALGCILYQMIYGRPPFDRFPSNRRMDAIIDPNNEIIYNRHRDPRYPEVEDVDDEMLGCVQSTLRFHVVDRATIPDLLRHPFLRLATEDDQVDAKEGDRMGAEEGSETVTISRATLRNLVGRIRVLALQQELTEDNVAERADLLFNNLKQAQA